jgi:hypothetical protein
VFWLDLQTRRRRPDEPDDLYSVRLHLELLSRKALNPENQEVSSPFAAQGIDDTHPEFEADLTRYIAGEPVDWLNKFVVSAPADHDTEALNHAAENLVKVHRRNYSDFKQQLADRATAALRHAAEQLMTADFRDEAKPLVEAGQALLAAPDADEGRAQVRAATEQLSTRVRKLDECRSTVELAVERQQGGDASTINAISQLEIQESRRSQQIGAALDAVMSGPSEASLSELWKTLSLLHKDVANRGRGLVSQLESAAQAGG